MTIVSGNLKERVGILDVSALSVWVRAVGGQYYTVRFDSTAPTACINTSGEMIIPTPNANMTIRDAIRLRGFCIHETSHIRYQPKIMDILRREKIKADSPLGPVFNIISDINAESRRAREWPGDGKALSQHSAVSARDTEDRLSKMVTKGHMMDDNFKKISAVFMAGYNAAGSVWNTGAAIGYRRIFNEVYDDDVRDMAANLESRFDLTNVLVNDCEAIDEEGLFQLSKDIFEFLWEKDPEQEVGGGGDEKGEPSDEPGDEEGEDGEQPSDADGEDSDETGEKGEKSDSKGKATKKIPIEVLIHEPHVPYETDAGGGHGQGFDYTKHKSSNVYVPVDVNKFKVINYGKEGM
jgi:hypothetical protein